MLVHTVFTEIEDRGCLEDTDRRVGGRLEDKIPVYFQGARREGGNERLMGRSDMCGRQRDLEEKRIELER